MFLHLGKCMKAKFHSKSEIYYGQRCNIKHIYNMFDMNTEASPVADMHTSKNLNKMFCPKERPRVHVCLPLSLLDVCLLLGRMVRSVGSQHGSRTGVRPLLEQGPRRRRVRSRLCFVAFGEAAWPRTPVRMKTFALISGCIIPTATKGTIDFKATPQLLITSAQFKGKKAIWRFMWRRFLNLLAIRLDYQVK